MPMQTNVAPNRPSDQGNARGPTGKRGRTGAVATPRQRHKPEGQGRRLALSFQALETFPALAESRDRLLSAIGEEHLATADVVTAIESDIALTIAVLRLANTQTPAQGRVDTVRAAVQLLRPKAIQAVASRVPTFDFFEHASVWESAPERFRLHALATQRTADRIAVEVHYENLDRLAVTSLLHDVGKLVLIRAYPGYPSHVHQGARTPDERARYERRELSIDHTLLGGVLVGRWGLPASLASAVEHHHDADAEGEAAIIRLADMLAHYERGAPVAPNTMLQSARALGLGPDQLRRLIFELPRHSDPRKHPVDPCPLSEREVRVLQRLADGDVYKQIARELAVSVSTVRSHLHNIYGKLGVLNRAQAVLLAAERGWI
jgi:DNA-binding CsgD family transcriptional regulator/HD-like signal output (HDOD) protein